MREEREEFVKNILSYLDGKEKACFSGGIRMGFEDGRPHSFAETKNPDREIPEAGPNFNIAEEIKTACSAQFYGTLFLVYENGRITRFNPVRTFQGKALEEMLQTRRQFP